VIPRNYVQAVTTSKQVITTRAMTPSDRNTKKALEAPGNIGNPYTYMQASERKTNKTSHHCVAQENPGKQQGARRTPEDSRNVQQRRGNSKEVGLSAVGSTANVQKTKRSKSDLRLPFRNK
jgi:hypothetical protein